jgi:hypothetical protein
MFNSIVGAGRSGAGAASRCDQMMRLRLRNTAFLTHFFRDNVPLTNHKEVTDLTNKLNFLTSKYQIHLSFYIIILYHPESR